MKTTIILLGSEMLQDSCTDGQVLETTTVSEQQQGSSVQQADLNEMGNVRVSHLWSQPQDTSSSEIPDAQPDRQLMEEYHGIKPKVTQQKFVNPWKFNTLKVMTISLTLEDDSLHIIIPLFCSYSVMIKDVYIPNSKV